MTKFVGYLVERFQEGWRLVEGIGKNAGEWMADNGRDDHVVFRSRREAEDHIHASIAD